MPPSTVSALEAHQIIVAAAYAQKRKMEIIKVGEAHQRILAQDLVARRTHPPMDVSAMDGFALRCQDLVLPSLKIVGESAAGHPYNARLQMGEAIKISTGAWLPEGADAVLMKEHAGVVAGDQLQVQIALTPGQFIRQKGKDFFAGNHLLHAGSRLTPALLALASAMNHDEVPVFPRPKIAILSTGDELVPVGGRVGAGEIIASNACAIAAMLQAAGAEVIDLGLAKDNRASLEAAFMQAWQAKVKAFITIGGASVGEHDLVKQLAQEQGAVFDFSRILMRPGKPFNFGQWRGSLLAGLPGNPVSALVCARLFLVPMVSALQGDRAAMETGEEYAFLGAYLPANDERQDYIRAVLLCEEGKMIAKPLSDQDSSLLSVLVAAQVLIIRPPHAPAAFQGESCKVIRL